MSSIDFPKVISSIKTALSKEFNINQHVDDQVEQFTRVIINEVNRNAPLIKNV